MRRAILILLTLLLPLLLTVGCEGGAVTEPGDLYRRYADRDGLTVAQVSDFRLNDTACADVVLVVADDSIAWQRLAQELDMKDSLGVTSWLADPQDPSQRVRWTGTPALRIVASPQRLTVGFYTIADEGCYDALLDYQLNSSL